jgi:hypothetical protein
MLDFYHPCISSLSASQKERRPPYQNNARDQQRSPHEEENPFEEAKHSKLTIGWAHTVPAKLL